MRGGGGDCRVDVVRRGTMKAPDETMRDINGAIYGAEIAVRFMPGMPLLTPQQLHDLNEILVTLADRVTQLMRPPTETEPEATDGE